MAFPVNVPNAPGVPSVNFAAATGAVLSFLTADAAGIFAGLFGGQQWGIYLDGAPVILADNVVTVDYRNSWTISDYPVEQGGFESYDKVATPFQARLRFSTGGSQSDRAAFIASVDAISSDLNLYDVVTPERIYINCNVNRVTYGRSGDRGAGLIVIDVELEEIRIQAAPVGTNTASPTSAPPINGGSVQPTAPTPAQTSQVPNIGGPPQFQ